MKKFPYFSRDGAKCLFKKQDIGATCCGYKTIKKGSEEALQEAVAEVGPISVGIDASHESFQLYKKGLYYEPGNNEICTMNQYISETVPSAFRLLFTIP